MKKVKKLSRDAKKIGPATPKATATPRHVLRHVKADPLSYKFKKPEGAPDRKGPRTDYASPNAGDIELAYTGRQDYDLGLLMLMANAAGWKDYIIVHGHYTIFARKTA